MKLMCAVLNGVRAVSLTAYIALWRHLLARHIAGTYKRGTPLTVVMQDRNDGFFSIFFQVLGMADLCLARRHNLVVDFCNGPYVRRDKGANWWAYYFESARFLSGPENASPVTVSNLRAQYQFSDYGRSLPPAYAHALMRTMGIVVKADIRRKVADFAEARFCGQMVVGIHYRGTDKVRGDGKRAESTRVPYAYVRDYLQRCHPSSCFFVATDEARFLDFLMAQFPGRIIACERARSADGNAMHFGPGGTARDMAGEEALIDCLLLSRCHALIRTKSNLSLASCCFNPLLKAVDLTDLYVSRQKTAFRPACIFCRRHNSRIARSRADCFPC